jgi:hypothetical protein
MAWPATPALPLAVNGRMSAALTAPVPIVAPGGTWALCGDGGGVVDRKLELPEQPARSVPAVASKLAIVRRRVGNAADARPCNSAHTAVLLTAAKRQWHTATAICHSGGE